jgi:cytochrome o ubiquinol oxidase subunit II
MLLLSGCDLVVMSPSGDIAAQQRDLIIISTVLMLLIIVPVMILTVVFAWRYRQNNTSAPYDPDWDHSTQLELVIWAVPLLIIICLGAVTWMSTHLLDPYRPLDRIGENRPVDANQRPLEVNVVALDWKWLFIYPEYGIASVNEMAAPVDRPIQFRLTSSSVMNSFYVPAMAGMIYAMPGMETKLHAVINNPGDYEGFSANYSGHGFSHMRFRFHGVDDAGFDQWIEKVRADGGELQRENYLELERPSENNPVQYFAQIDPLLFDAVRNMCVDAGKMCMSEMAMIDRDGGLGLAGLNNMMPLIYDKTARRGGAVFGADPVFVASICTVEEALAAGQQDPGLPQTAAQRAPIRGAGLPRTTPISLNTSLSLGPLRPSNI